MKALSDKTTAKQICKVEGKGVLDAKRASTPPGEQVGGVGGSAPTPVVVPSMALPGSLYPPLQEILFLLLINDMLMGKKF